MGRKPHDPTRVAAVTSHRASITTPAPLVLPRADIVWTPTLAANDQLPTCTIAGLINSARMWALLHGFDLVNAEAQLLAFYAAVAGCADTEAAIAATDGLVLLDVLEHAQKVGFDIGAQAPLVPEFTAIHMPDIAGIRDAIYSRGTAYIGVTLYEADMAPGATWTGGIANVGAVVGGHCIDPCRYTETDFSVATWGGEIEADDEWISTRTDEAYAVSWTFPV